MIDYRGALWHHPQAPDGVAASDRADRGVAHRHELLVDQRDWPAVLHALEALNLTYSQNGATRYGLVRIALADSYDHVLFEQDVLRAVQARVETGLRPRLGRNRLAAHARLEFDDLDVDSTPKVVPSHAGLVPSGFGTAELATGQKLAPRTIFDSGDGVRVGAVDTAFFRHTYLEGACLYHPVEPSAAYDDGEVGSAAGHATFVAGLILQMAPGAHVTAENVVPSNGVTDLVTVHDAICRLAESGVRVINLSLGCVTADDEAPFVLSHAIEWALAYAAVAGRPAPVFVAASGNDIGAKHFWPAADERVVAVAAATRHEESWRIAEFSGWGSWVDVAAPGDNLLSTRANFGKGQLDYDCYAYWSGTSFAAAVISGLIASHIRATGSAQLDPAAAPMAGLTTKQATHGTDSRQVPVYGAEEVIIKA